MINILVTIAVSAVVAFGSLFATAPLLQQSPLLIPEPVVVYNDPIPTFGADGTLPLAGTTYTLSGAGVSNSATSITLTSFTIPQTGHEVTDSELSDTFFVTLEPGNRTRQEVVSCTTVTQNADNTATLSGCTRGLLPFSPYTASSSYQFAHGGGTSVVFSNPPQLYNEFGSKLNATHVTSTWNFSANAAPYYDAAPNFNGSSTNLFASLAYVNSVATSGSPDASPTAKGLVEISTRPEFSAGTVSGDSTALLSPANSYFNATSSATTTGVVTGVNGKISNSFISTSSDYTWTGTSTFTGSTTFTGIGTHSATNTFTGNTYGLNIPKWFASTSVASTTVVGASLFQSLSTTTVSPDYAQRLFITVVGVAIGSPLNNPCSMSVAIDNVLVDSGQTLIQAIGSVDGGPLNMAFSWISDPLTAASHTINIRGKSNGAGTTCNFILPRITYMGI